MRRLRGQWWNGPVRTTRPAASRATGRRIVHRRCRYSRLSDAVDVLGQEVSNLPPLFIGQGVGNREATDRLLTETRHAVGGRPAMRLWVWIEGGDVVRVSAVRRPGVRALQVPVPRDVAWARALRGSTRWFRSRESWAPPVGRLPHSPTWSRGASIGHTDKPSEAALLPLPAAEAAATT